MLEKRSMARQCSSDSRVVSTEDGRDVLDQAVEIHGTIARLASECTVPPRIHPNKVLTHFSERSAEENSASAPVRVAFTQK